VRHKVLRDETGEIATVKLHVRCHDTDERGPGALFSLGVLGGIEIYEECATISRQEILKGTLRRVRADKTGWIPESFLELNHEDLLIRDKEESRM
jgi:hypothetical protein